MLKQQFDQVIAKSNSQSIIYRCMTARKHGIQLLLSKHIARLTWFMSFLQHSGNKAHEFIKSLQV